MKPTPDKWTENWSAEQTQLLKTKIEQAKDEWNSAYENRMSPSVPRLCRNFGPWENISRASNSSTEKWDTGVPRDTLRYILAKSVDVPETFKLHDQLQRHVKSRMEAAETGQKIDWGSAEAMAFGSLLQQGMALNL